MVDFTRGFSHPTDLQKKIANVLQSSELIQQKQKDLVITLFYHYFFFIVNYIYLHYFIFRKCLG